MIENKDFSLSYNPQKYVHKASRQGLNKRRITLLVEQEKSHVRHIFLRKLKLRALREWIGISPLPHGFW